MAENRTGKRFPLQLPIRVHKAQAGDEHQAVTGNLSAAGVYIQGDASLDVGSQVEFEITLPPEVTGGQQNVTIQGRGRVVRTDSPPPGHNRDSNYRGVACVIDSYEFVRNT